MIHKIVISVYTEERYTGKRTMVYTDIRLTDRPADTVVASLGLLDGYEVHVINGSVISFIDFYCIAISPNIIINRFKNITNLEEKSQEELPAKCIIKIRQQNNDKKLTRTHSEIIYTCHHYNCGASGLSETILEITEWSSAHPFAMIFISGIIYDVGKCLVNHCIMLMQKSQKHGSYERNSQEVIVFNPRKFQNDFSKLSNISRKDFQVISISRCKLGKRMIKVRTVTNSYYDIVVRANGQIVSYEEGTRNSHL